MPYRSPKQLSLVSIFQGTVVPQYISMLTLNSSWDPSINPGGHSFNNLESTLFEDAYMGISQIVAL